MFVISKSWFYKDIPQEEVVKDKVYTSDTLPSEILECMQSNQLETLQAIQNLVSLDQLKEFTGVKNPTALAQAEAKLLSYDLHIIAAGPTYLSLASDKANKALHAVLHYILLKVVGGLINIGKDLYNSLIMNPLSIAWAAYQLQNLGALLAQIVSLHENLHHYSTEKVSLLLQSSVYAARIPSIGKALGYAAEAAAALTFLGLFYLYSHYNIELAQKLKKSQFVDLTEKARSGESFPTIGGRHDINSLAMQLSSTPLGKGVCVILLGPPGVGKTQTVTGLAALVAQGAVPALNGRSILSINTAELTATRDMKSNFDQILYRIEGQEDRVVLFFDEAHTMNKENGENSLLQLFKTKVQERNISVIFATTQEEYEKQLAIDKPFVSRLRKIEINEPLDIQTKIILQKVALRLNVAIDSAAIDRIIDLTKTLKPYCDDCNPRKSLNAFEDCLKQLRFLSSTALLSSSEPATDEETTMNELITHSREMNTTNPAWLVSKEGQEALAAIEAQKQKLNAAEERQKGAYRDQAHKLKLLQLHEEYTLRIHQLAVKLINPGLSRGARESAEIEYLFTKFFLAPQSTKSLEKFNIPYKIDVKLVESYLNPSK